MTTGRINQRAFAGPVEAAATQTRDGLHSVEPRRRRQSSAQDGARSSAGAAAAAAGERRRLCRGGHHRSPGRVASFWTPDTDPPRRAVKHGGGAGATRRLASERRGRVLVTLDGRETVAGRETRPAGANRHAKTTSATAAAHGPLGPGQPRRVRGLVFFSRAADTRSRSIRPPTEQTGEPAATAGCARPPFYLAN